MCICEHTESTLDGGKKEGQKVVNEQFVLMLWRFSVELLCTIYSIRYHEILHFFLLFLFLIISRFTLYTRCIFNAHINTKIRPFPSNSNEAMMALGLITQRLQFFTLWFGLLPIWERKLDPRMSAHFPGLKTNNIFYLPLKFHFKLWQRIETSNSCNEEFF